MTDVKQKAWELLRESKRPVFFVEGIEAVISTLSAANILHDPEEVERGKAALEACAKYAIETAGLGLSDWSEPVRAIGRAELERRKPRPAPLDEVLSLWRECKCKVPGPLSDALDRLAAERTK